MTRTNTLAPYQVRREVFTVAPTVVAPGATVALATAAPLAFNPAWPLAEIRVAYTFIGSAVDAAAGSNPQVRMVSDPAGAANVRGVSAAIALGAGLAALFPWLFFGLASDTPAFDNGQVLQLQGLNAGGAGNVTFEGVLALDVFMQEAP